MRGFIGGYEAFRKLGFSPDDIYCNLARSMRHGGVLSCFVLLKAQGKEFALEIGFVADENKFADEYQRVCESRNSIPESDLERMWQESEACRDKMGFLMAMTAKGFYWPKGTN